ncbi:MAG: two-component system sensor histidine kinase CreC [Verrucomicrobiaceae bacterium]|nr:two-component system sensor histidine kinase CreC [Verrucomicrobiaceae bacterium]
MTLTARLLFGFVLVAAGGFYFITDRVLKRVERQYLEAVEEPMVDAANILAAALEQDIQDGALDAARFGATFAAAKKREFEAKIYDFTKTHINLEAYITDDKGIVIFDSAEPAAVGTSLSNRRDVRITLAGGYGARSTRADEADDDSSVMFVGAPIRDGPRIIGAVSVSKPQRAVFQFRDETRHWLLWHISLIIVCMVLASYLVAKWAARPVERLTEYARAITRGERPAVPRLPGSDLKTLGSAFEKMRDELQGREYVENYVQTLTHELKSPVAAVQGAAELLAENPPPEQRARFLGNIMNETRRLHGLIDRLLELAALEKRKSLDEVRKLDVAELVATAIDHLAPLIQRRELKVQQDIPALLTVRGDAFLLDGALINLLQNAIEFSPEGGTIQIIARHIDDSVHILVEDEGPGVPDFAKQRVFERFYSLPRPDTGHKSSGLGLCFVREVALLHGGGVSLENIGERGTRAVLTIKA